MEAVLKVRPVPACPRRVTWLLDAVHRWVDAINEQLDELLNDFDEGKVTTADVRRWIVAAEKALPYIPYIPGDVDRPHYCFGPVTLTIKYERGPRTFDQKICDVRDLLSRAYPSWTIKEALETLGRPAAVSVFDVMKVVHEHAWGEGVCEEYPRDELAYLLRFPECRARDAQFLAAGYKPLFVPDVHHDADVRDYYHRFVYGRADVPDDALRIALANLLSQPARELIDSKIFV